MGLMPKKLPKGVVVDKDRHRNVRLYFRAPGRSKVRLRETPGTREFDDEVACARLGQPYERAGEGAKPLPVGKPAAEGTLDWLSQQYKKRVVLDDGTKARRVRMLEEIADSGLTPADRLLERFHGEWGGDIGKVFEECAY